MLFCYARKRNIASWFLLSQLISQHWFQPTMWLAKVIKKWVWLKYRSTNKKRFCVISGWFHAWFVGFSVEDVISKYDYGLKNVGYQHTATINMVNIPTCSFPLSLTRPINTHTSIPLPVWYLVRLSTWKMR